MAARREIMKYLTAAFLGIVAGERAPYVECSRAHNLGGADCNQRAQNTLLRKTGSALQLLS
jgi:hypothetical protein